jgi:hypothetical protein
MTDFSCGSEFTGGDVVDVFNGDDSLNAADLDAVDVLDVVYLDLVAYVCWCS